MRHNKLPRECLQVLILFTILFTLVSILGCKDTKPPKTAKPAKPVNEKTLVNHSVLSQSNEQTDVSNIYDIKILVSNNISRDDLKELLLHYMNKQEEFFDKDKKNLVYIYAYPDSVKHKREGNWVGMLQYNQFHSDSPMLTYDVGKLADN